MQTPPLTLCSQTHSWQPIACSSGAFSQPARVWLVVWLAVLIGWFCPPTQAQLLSGKGGELPLQTVVTPHFRVLHPPRLEAYARRVAAAAEYVHEAVVGTVGNDPGLTYILVNDETDEFNGYALPGPYPFIRVYAAFPRPTDIGAQFQDVMVELVGHEFTHVAHLTTRNDLRRAVRGVFGSLPSLLDARVPPAWFVEGYAVYLESKLTTGGRVRDSTTRTIRRSIARGGAFPSLSDAGIGTLESYPYGNTRYVFGAGFVDFLADRFGEAGIRRAIARYNETLTFDDAWRDVSGVTLEALWAEWAQEETKAARLESDTLVSSGLPSGQVLHLGSGVPAWQGTRYAFMQGNSVRFASLDGSRETLEPGFVILPSRPNRLSFAADGALVYSRLVARGTTTYGEVFRLQNGLEQQLTVAARAKDAVADGPCILYVEDHLEQSRLRQICGAENRVVFAAPDGWHLFQPAVNAGHEIALTVWRPGGFLDVALLKSDKLAFLTSDAAQDQFPAWLPDGRLVFSSDRSGIAQLYQVQLYQAQPGGATIQPITASANGAFAVSVSKTGALAFSAYTSSGLETRLLLAWTPTASIQLKMSEPQPLKGLSGAAYPVEAFAPNLAPLFWNPLTGNGLGATVYGADAAGVNSYQLSAGYDLLTGTGFNAAAAYSFAPRLDWSLNAGVSFTSSGGWNASLSAPFAGKSESQLTGRFEYTVTPYATLENSAASLGFSVRFDALGRDVFGYTVRGWRTTLNLDTTGLLSASLTLADAVQSLPVTLALRLDVAAPKTPSLTARLETHVSFGIHWRSPDGFVGLERVTLLPFVTLQAENAVYRLGFGAQALLDLNLYYYLPLSLGVEVAWSGNAWTLRLVSLVPLLQGLR